MSESEDDYMSDAFLSQIPDTRPGLIHGEKARKLIQEERIKAKDRENREKMAKISRKSVVTMMTERREDSLSTHMTEAEPENKGLKLMMKMGFKIGSGLGREGEGRKNPVEIGQVKLDKKGIGKGESEAAAKKRARDDAIRLAAVRKQAAKVTKSNFQVQTKERQTHSRRMRFVRQAQKAAFDLDHRHNIQQPTQSLFWPPSVAQKLENGAKRQRMSDRADSDEPSSRDEPAVIDTGSESEEEFDPAQLLDEITSYLRAKYFYCIYCGCMFDDSAQMEAECPGNAYELHDEL